MLTEAATIPIYLPEARITEPVSSSKDLSTAKIQTIEGQDDQVGIIPNALAFLAKPVTLAQSFAQETKIYHQFFQNFEKLDRMQKTVKSKEALSIIEKSFAIYDQASPRTQEKIRARLLKKPRHRTNLAVALVLQFVNNNKRVPEFEALISQYKKIGILDTVLSSKIKMVGSRKAITIDKRIRRASTRLGPEERSYGDALKDVHLNQSPMQVIKKPVSKQLAAPQPSSEVQVFPAYT